MGKLRQTPSSGPPTTPRIRLGPFEAAALLVSIAHPRAPQRRGRRNSYQRWTYMRAVMRLTIPKGSRQHARISVLCPPPTRFGMTAVPCCVNLIDMVRAKAKTRKAELLRHENDPSLRARPNLAAVSVCAVDVGRAGGPDGGLSFPLSPRDARSVLPAWMTVVVLESRLDSKQSIRKQAKSICRQWPSPPGQSFETDPCA
ncbi:hypothetical protein B0T10DRAFT_247646 [Thelonectria olida]|uniref:Uncharacterized protein n=1 Tax=Thelonectria olida TaxID=1576542 RepID=A0A9P8W9Q3_9HYPO|nr:hypothetical protein B0T10DRAFT_247646 [Thelonectria olida]